MNFAIHRDIHRNQESIYTHRGHDRGRGRHHRELPCLLRFVSGLITFVGMRLTPELEVTCRFLVVFLQLVTSWFFNLLNILILIGEFSEVKLVLLSLKPPESGFK